MAKSTPAPRAAAKAAAKTPREFAFRSTQEIAVPARLIDWIIGQERGVRIIKKAAAQRRNVLLIGQPGTGKSMLAQAMAELMPREELEDMLAYPNQYDENQPVIKVVKTFPPELVQKYEAEKKQPADWAGQGRQIVAHERAAMRAQGRGVSPLLLLLLVMAALMFIVSMTGFGGQNASWVFAATILGILIFGGFYMATSGMTRRLGLTDMVEPKLIVDNSGKTNAPFVDATGARAGALFGDVKHDPLQTGGLGTPAHLRVESGAIHRANKGVLFVDEVSSLIPKSQQDLLTAMQDKRFSITGQSEMSSGALVKTQPVPCDFVLIAAGNMLDIQNMHPALRSRIRGYGYEVYMEDVMPDTAENRFKLVQFIAQEVKKDGKIPHFSREAVELIIDDARRKAGRKGKLTVRLRELGGLVRAAGDVSREKGGDLVSAKDVIAARELAAPLEQQISRQLIEARKDYRVFVTRGFKVGRVNGLAVLGEGASGLILPIVAEVTPASSRSEGKLIATGKLGEIAKEAVENVSAIIKKHMGKDVSKFDMHVQFLQTYEGVEGDSASISIAVAVLSAMEGLAVDQSIAMTGSLSVRGEVLPVGGITAKVEAAIEAGCREVLIPKANEKDVYLDKDKRARIIITPVSTLEEVLVRVLKETPARDQLVDWLPG